MLGIVSTLYLIDGELSGRIRCTLDNWSGVAYSVPESRIKECENIDEFNHGGVYILLGGTKEGEEIAYIGKADVRNSGEGLLSRIREKHDQIESWNRAIVLTDINNEISPTESSYLEKQLYDLATKAERMKIANSNTPNSRVGTKEKECELQRFVQYALTVVSLLGCDIFIPLVSENERGNEGAVFSYKGELFDAKCIRNPGGFVLLRGSKIAPECKGSCPSSAVKNRDKYCDLIDADHRTTEDILFNSSSAAADFVSGISVSGPQAWKNSKNISLKTVLDLEI